MKARHTKGKLKVFILFAGAFLTVISLYAVMSSRSPMTTSAEGGTVVCTVLEEDEPVPELGIILEILTADGKRFTVNGVSSNNGSVTEEIPVPFKAPVTLEKAILSDAWMIQTVVGDRTYRLSEAKWNLTDAQAFLNGCSNYAFSQVHPQQSEVDGHLRLSLKLYMLPARIIAVYNSPTQPEGFLPFARYSFPGIREYVNFELEDKNSVAVDGSALVAIPVGQPLKMAALAKVFDSSWHIKIEVDVGNRDTVDLSAPTVRAVSAAQVEQLSAALSTLEAVGFDVEELYGRVGRIRADYEEAAMAMELSGYSQGFELVQSAWGSYTDIYFSIREVYANVLPWTVSVTLILAFLSVTLAYLVSEQENIRRMLMPPTFLLFVVIFAYTQPHVRLFIIAFAGIVEKLDVHLLVSLVQMLPWVIIAVALSAYPKFRDLLWETFGVMMRNMRRRRLRTALTFSTIVVVSASAMCVLSITHHVPLDRIPLLGLGPTVPNGLVVSRYEILTPRPVGGEKATKGDSYPLSILPHEAAWIMSQPGVVQANIYGLRRVRISDSRGESLPDLSTFYLAVVKPSFIKEYCTLDSSKDAWLDENGSNAVLIGSKIANAYSLQVGDEILIDDRVFTVKGTFDEIRMVEEWKEIDGQNLFFGIYDPLDGSLSGESFLIGSANDFQLGTFDVYRISLVSNDTRALDSLVESILQRGYSREVTPLYEVTRTYFVHAIEAGAVTSIYYGPSRLALAGPLHAQMVVVALSGLMVFMNVFASVSERKNDIMAMYVAGASPLRIRMVFIAEALALGLTGGIYGYITGFTFSRAANLMSPGAVQMDLSGSAPFLISVSVSLLPSVMGSLSPSKQAMLSIVPSRRTLQKGADVLFTRDQKVFIDIPIRIHGRELDSFDSFLENFAKRFPPVRYGYDGLSVLDVKKMEGERDLTYTMELNYAVERSLYYRVTILLIKDKEAREIQVGVFPLDPWERKVTDWSREHAGLLPRLATYLRSELLKYAEWKGEGSSAARKVITKNQRY